MNDQAIQHAETRILYKNAVLFTRERRFEPGCFAVENGRFARPDPLPGWDREIDLEGNYVIPGLVDIHTHGCAGSDFSDGDLSGLRRMAAYYAQHGITSFAPTSMTLPYDVLAKAFETAVQYRSQRPAKGARLAGIHMEGPFFSKKKRGAQNACYLKNPDFTAFCTLYEKCEGLIRIVDVAPELEGAASFAAKASQLCRVSVAHTDSDYETACSAFDAGASHLTHLFNAMPPLHHRAPGVIGAASERENILAELICDGLHVHPSAVRMAFKLFPGRICLISDSLRCCGMSDGTYTLGGQDIVLKDRLATLKDGTIAGSATNLYDCMQTAVRFGIPKEDAVAAATILPAIALGAEQEIGSIEPGKHADFVICDASLCPTAVFIAGRPVSA